MENVLDLLVLKKLGMGYNSFNDNSNPNIKSHKYCWHLTAHQSLTTGQTHMINANASEYIELLSLILGKLSKTIADKKEMLEILRRYNTKHIEPWSLSNLVEEILGDEFSELAQQFKAMVENKATAQI